MLPLPVLILIGVVLSILIGLGSYQFYFKEWNSCDWGYGSPTPSTPSTPTPSAGPAPAPCDANQRIKGGVCVACGEGYINPAGDDPAEFTDTFCKMCAENYHVSGRKCVECGIKYTHPAGDIVTDGNTECSECTVNHRASGGKNCVTCDIGAGGEGAYRSAGDDRYGPETKCINYLKKGIPKVIELGSGCRDNGKQSQYCWRYMQHQEQFKASFPGGWTNDLKCKYDEANHTTDEAWKKSCPGGDPDVMYSYTIPPEWVPGRMVEKGYKSMGMDLLDRNGE